MLKGMATVGAMALLATGSVTGAASPVDGSTVLVGAQVNKARVDQPGVRGPVSKSSERIIRDLVAREAQGRQPYQPTRRNCARSVAIGGAVGAAAGFLFSYGMLLRHGSDEAVAILRGWTLLGLGAGALVGIERCL